MCMRGSRSWQQILAACTVPCQQQHQHLVGFCLREGCFAKDLLVILVREHLQVFAYCGTDRILMIQCAFSNRCLGDVQIYHVSSSKPFNCYVPVNVFLVIPATCLSLIDMHVNEENIYKCMASIHVGVHCTSNDV